MNSIDLLVDAFGRVRGALRAVLDDVSDDALVFRPDADANSIAWLIWHLSRVQDSHIAELDGGRELWQDWNDRFGLSFDVSASGYGQSSAEVGQVRVGADLLSDYYDAVHERTIGYLRRITADDFGRVVDEAWDPPVTLGVRLVSVISDELQHVGQAAYVRGLATRAGL